MLARCPYVCRCVTPPFGVKMVNTFNAGRITATGPLAYVAPSGVFFMSTTAGPRLRNSLPSHLKEADLSYNRFQRLLKTFLFRQWGHGAV